MIENNLMGAWYYKEEELKCFGFKHLGKNVLIKKNTTIFNPSNIILEDNARVEDWVLLLASGDVGITLRAHSYIASHCCLLGRGGIEMGEFSTLAPHVSLVSASDDYSGNTLTGLAVPAEFRGSIEGKIIIGRHVIIGINSSVMPGIHIGEGTAVGAHSLVRKNLPAWGIFAGNPIQFIKKREQKLLELEQQFKKTREVIV